MISLKITARWFVLRRGSFATCVVFASTFLSVSTGTAQSATTRMTRQLSLGEAIEIGVQHNADVLMARTTIDSANGEQRIARAIPNPTYLGSPGVPYQYGVSIPIDIGPQRSYRTRVASLGVAATRLDAQSTTSQIVLAIERAYYDVLLADAQRQLAQSRRESIHDLYSADSIRAKAGDIADRNLVRSNIEVARANAEVARASLAAKEGRLALQALLGAAEFSGDLLLSDTLRYDESTVPTLDSLTRQALTQRPDLKAAAERVLQATARASLATAALVPVPTLSYVRQFSAPFESGHFYSLGLSVELPIFNTYRGERERAQAGRQAAEYSRDRVATQVRRDVESARNSVQAQSEIINRYAKGLNVAVDGSVISARYAYEHGATSLLDVIDALRVQREVQNEYLVALHDYWLARFALDAASGSARR